MRELQTQAGYERWRPVAAVAATVLVVAGAVVAVVAFADRTPVEPVLGFVGVGLVIATPGLVGLLALRDRPDLWLAAALGAFLTSFLASVWIVVVLPVAVVLAYGWVRHVPPARRSAVHPLALAVLLQVLLVAAAGALFLSDDPRTWETYDSSGRTSDIITNAEAALSLTAVATALVVAWVLGRPRRVDSGDGGSPENPDETGGT